MKYYAVKKGRPNTEPAVYKTWEECKKQVQGVSGAIYKSFEKEEDAYEYIKPDSSNKSLEREGVLYIFVDGSYNKNTNVSGYGMALVMNGKVIYQSKKTLTCEKYTKYRNVYGEVQGTEDALRVAIDLGYKEVSVVYDYTGIENWALGNWKANNQLTKRYSEEMSKLLKEIKVNFIKVKAHAKDVDGGHQYNELVDKLAKESVGIYA